MKKGCLLVLLLNLLFLTARSSPPDSVMVKKKYFTKAIVGAITLDGNPAEEAWNAVDWGGDFTQWEPNGGKPPGQQTSFKVLYDEKFLYVAFRCHDSAPDSIVKRLGRRD